MRPDLVVLKLSTVGVALLVLSLAAGLGLSALTQNATPAVVFALIGLYLLFAIRMADQWEKVAVLRFGKYIGLRGPGTVSHDSGGGHAEPVRGPAGARGERVGGIDADARYGAGQRGCDRVLDGVERGEIDSGSAGLHAGHRVQRADGAARIDRPPRVAPDGGGARTDGQRAATDSRREDDGMGDHRAVGGDSRRADSAGAAGRHVAAKRRRNANGVRASSWARRRRRSPRSSGRPR